MVESRGLAIPLPPPLMTSEAGSFAQRTIVVRKPQIISQVVEDNDYPPDVLRSLEAFAQETTSLPIRPLTERATDVESWNEALAAYDGRTWLEVPWYLAEAFFYRRLLEIVRYFQPGPWEARDPFARQKRALEEAAVDQLVCVWAQLAAAAPDVAFEALLYSSLWGNRTDLSNYTVVTHSAGGLAAREERHHIVIDHSEAVREHLVVGVGRVDFISDNVGLDLLFDLALADFVLAQGWAERVVLHLKRFPFFVSDACCADVQAVVRLLRKVDDAAVRGLGDRLHGYEEGHCLVLADEPFWASHRMFRELPPALRSDLARSDLVILKGDVNYRRLLDDRHWPYTTRMEDAAAHFPAPFLVLRTLKGEIVVGLEPGQAETLAAQDPAWLINGKRGVVQLVIRRSAPLQKGRDPNRDACPENPDKEMI